MKITPTTLTLNQLFSSGNEQFLVPAYQRRYSWKEKQVNELFDDINLLINNDTHFLGSIVCLTDSHTAGINILEIVDGQQRITTLMLFLKAIQERYVELESDEDVRQIDNLIFCRGLDRKQRNKTILGDLDKDDYQYLMNIDLDRVKNQDLLNAYVFIRNRLENLDKPGIDTLYFKLINSVVVIRLDVGEARDAYKLFEMINNRGLRLSPTDIIKNFLLGHSSIFDENILEKVKNNWTGLIINLDYINTDDFFRQYMAGVLGRKVNMSNLVDEFKKYYLSIVEDTENLPEYKFYKITENTGDKDNINSKLSVVQFSKELRDASEIYSKLITNNFPNKDINKHLKNLEKIRSFPTYIFLMPLFRKNVTNKDRVEIISILETFMLRRNVCEYRTGELDDIFSNLVSLIGKKDIVKNIKDSLKVHLPGNDEFKEKIMTHNFKGGLENRAKYVLEQLEYELINKTGEIKIDEVHLEHIIPQTIDTKISRDEYGDWISYLGKNAIERHREYVNRIGNLTILAESINISISNNPYAAKVKEYKKSNIKLNKIIIRKYKEFRFEQVEERSEEIAKKAVRIWKF